MAGVLPGGYRSRVRAVFALPVAIARTQVGALDLFRERPGPLAADALHGGLWAAELAALPLSTLLNEDVDWAALVESGDGWAQLASLQRVEVYQATGILLADPRGVLHLVAASSETSRSLELFQLQRDHGPCLDCYRSGSAVMVADLRAERDRWPAFVPFAIDAGFASVHAVLLRLRDDVLGAMGLSGDHAGVLDDDDLSLAQALGYVAAVALTQERAASDAARVNEQLQRALDSRVVLEQAKGVLAQRGGLEMEQAFAVLRRYARDHNLRLTDVAAAVVARRLPAERLVDHAARSARRPAGPAR